MDWIELESDMLMPRLDINFGWAETAALSHERQVINVHPACKVRGYEVVSDVRLIFGLHRGDILIV